MALGNNIIIATVVEDYSIVTCDFVSIISSLQSTSDGSCWLCTLPSNQVCIVLCIQTNDV